MCQAQQTSHLTLLPKICAPREDCPSEYFSQEIKEKGQPGRACPGCALSRENSYPVLSVCPGCALSNENSCPLLSFLSNPTPHTLHPTPYTLHLTPYTLHSTSCTLHPTPHTLHPTPHTWTSLRSLATRVRCAICRIISAHACEIVRV